MKHGCVARFKGTVAAGGASAVIVSVGIGSSSEVAVTDGRFLLLSFQEGVDERVVEMEGAGIADVENAVTADPVVNREAAAHERDAETSRQPISPASAVLVSE